MDTTNLDPALRNGSGTMVSRLESTFESIVDCLLRNEELYIDLVSTRRSREPGDVR